MTRRDGLRGGFGEFHSGIDTRVCCTEPQFSVNISRQNSHRAHRDLARSQRCIRPELECAK
jgi:hypothetical protein